MLRYRILLAGILIQLCLGSVYAWSAFVPALRAAHGLTSAQAALIFGATIFSLTLAMVLAGWLLGKIGPRAICAAGAVLYAAGYLLASASSGAFLPLFLCVSILSGAGIGFCYVCPLAVCVQWFPERKGLITGLSVAGFGGGAVVLASAAARLIASGMDPLSIFRGIGIIYGFLIFIGALQLRFPPKAKANRSCSVPPYGVILSKPGFWVLAGGMFAGTFAGLLVIGNLKPLGLSLGISPNSAALAVSLFAVGNALGRIVWGWMHDRLGFLAIPAALACLAAGILSLSAPLGRSGFLGATVLTGFSFGACFVLFAAELAARHGAASIGRFYPLIFLFYGLAGILGPTLGGWLYDRHQSFHPAIYLGAGVAALGAIAYGVVRMRRESAMQFGAIPEAE